ncbi:MAG TPA: PspC domain-containing protein [Polyangiaceae bacterium]|nr:PspC domain-containing protein [Polyangiaceae bacterium]
MPAPSALPPLFPAAQPPSPVAPPLWQMPRLCTRERWLAGVACAIANEIGVGPLWIRVAFVLLTLSGGIGLALYAAAWLSFTYYERSHPARSYQPVPKGRTPRRRLLGVVAIVLGLVSLSEKTLALGVGDASLWPVGVAAFGMLLAWSSGKVDFAAPFELLRAVGGLVLVAAGIIGFIALNFGAAAAPKALLVSTIVLSGVVLVVAPWLWRAASQVSEARVERMRQAERAEVAAHLHDSVLQTLSLIQRSAGDRAATLSLARRQERELRDWLFGNRGAGAGPGTSNFRAALTELAGEVEALHGVPVEVVIVGDAALDEGLSTALAAAREAIVNAAKHSGAARVDVYAELGPASLELFVRDTGRGFEPGGVPNDRRGVSESIVGRMSRAGGRATIGSSAGRGTEVALVLPRRVA